MRSLLPAPAWVNDFVQVSLRVHETGSGQETLAALKAAGLDRCPRCGTALDLEGYRSTRTAYFSEEVLDCRGCRCGLVLRQEQKV
jgi:hypothetical protein